MQTALDGTRARVSNRMWGPHGECGFPFFKDNVYTMQRQVNTGVHRKWRWKGGGGKLTPSSGGRIMCFSANIYIKAFYLAPFVATTFVGP